MWEIAKVQIHSISQSQINSQVLPLECGMHIHTEKKCPDESAFNAWCTRTLDGSNKQYGTLKAGPHQKIANISWAFLLLLQAAGSKKGDSIFFLSCSLNEKREREKKRKILYFLCLTSMCGYILLSPFRSSVICLPRDIIDWLRRLYRQWGRG